MKNITFRSPRYIIPLILLPFFFLFFFIFQHWNAGDHVALVTKDSVAINQINPQMPGVGKQISEQPVKDKFEAYQDAFKHKTDFSALENIGIEQQGGGEGDLSSAYSHQDIKQLRAQKTLDSLQLVMRSGQADIDRQMQAIFKNKPRSGTGGQIRHNDPNRSPEEAFLSELQRINEGGQTTTARGTSQKGTDTYAEQMKMFREQMRLVDSIQQASQRGGGGSEKKKGDGRKSSVPSDPAADSLFVPLPVSLEPTVNSSSNAGVFHTLRNTSTSSMIAAMIDQDLKVNAGHRVRIKLLQDIYVGGNRVPKGTYVYAQVTGFQTSRINLSVTQIFLNAQALPVKLDVFDSDGYLGLYVPGSNFREFSKEIGTQATRGLSQLNTGDQNDPVNSLLNQLFQTGTSATTRMIKKEKAVLTYNYTIYLQEKQ